MTAPVQSPAHNGGQSKQPVMLRPFRVGAQSVDDEVYDQTLTPNASTQRFPLYSVPATAFLKDIYLLVEAQAAGNAANVAFGQDQAFACLDTVKFTDTNNAEIITPCSGWELYIINKFGGYKFSDDPKASPVYSITTGAVAAGGSFTFVLRIPVELVPRDALGALVNKSQSTPYRVAVTLAALGTIYTTAPTTAPTIRLRMTPVSYWEPTQVDGSGNPIAPSPPALGTTAFWNVTPYTVQSGTLAEQLASSVGYPLRNLIFVLDANGDRTQGEADFPDPFKLQLQSNIIVDRLKTLWKHRIAQDYGYTGAASDTAANARDNGVFVVPFNHDFGHKPGWENRRSYLRTSDGMRLKMMGSIGGAGIHKMRVLTNYVGMGPGSTLASVTT